MIFNDNGFRGIDISFYQGYPPAFPIIDLNKAVAYGIDFAIFKAGQGNYSDPAFKYNWPAVQGILPAHTYFYYDNDFTPQGQAATYWNIVKSDPKGMFWVDLEDRSNVVARHWDKWYVFLEEFNSLSGVGYDRLGIYTGFYYFKELTVDAPLASKNYFAKYKLWFANYPPDPFNPPYSVMDTPYPWSTCTILQSGTPTIGARVGVHSKEVDYNIFNGTKDDFFKIFGTYPEGGEPVATYKKVTTAELNLRSSPGVITSPSNDLGEFNLILNDIVEVSNSVPGWDLITRMWRGGVTTNLPQSPTGEHWAANAYLQDTVFTPPTSKHTVDVNVDGVNRFHLELD